MNDNRKFWQRKDMSAILFDSKDDPVYKYVSYETAIKIIESNSLFYSSAQTFNDPFDMTTSLIDCNVDLTDMENLFEDFEENDNKRRMIRHYKENPLELAEFLRGILEEARGETGISCFSKSYLKPLMWSHYSDKHFGICLGFAFEVCDSEDYLQAPVRYAQKLEKNHYVKDTRKAVYDWLFCKSHIWNYEEEIRRVSINKKGIIPFEKKELCEIHYGLRVSDDQIIFLKNLLQKNQYRIKQEKRMTINPDTFDLLAKDQNVL